jgi:hypothetical protein
MSPLSTPCVEVSESSTSPLGNGSTTMSPMAKAASTSAKSLRWRRARVGLDISSTVAAHAPGRRNLTQAFRVEDSHEARDAEVIIPGPRSAGLACASCSRHSAASGQHCESRGRSRDCPRGGAQFDGNAAAASLGLGGSASHCGISGTTSMTRREGSSGSGLTVSLLITTPPAISFATSTMSRCLS